MSVGVSKAIGEFLSLDSTPRPSPQPVEASVGVSCQRSRLACFQNISLE